MGVPAHVAIISLELDAERLAGAGLTPSQSWRKLPRQGVVNRSPFIILVRPGNPKKIHDYIDLARPGIGVIHPDPLTSGGANWAIIAEYGAGVRRHPDRPEAGYELLLGIWRNVVAQSSSARGPARNLRPVSATRSSPTSRKRCGTRRAAGSSST